MQWAGYEVCLCTVTALRRCVAKPYLSRGNEVVRIVGIAAFRDWQVGAERVCIEVNQSVFAASHLVAGKRR